MSNRKELSAEALINGTFTRLDRGNSGNHPALDPAQPQPSGAGQPDPLPPEPISGEPPLPAPMPEPISAPMPEPLLLPSPPSFIDPPESPAPAPAHNLQSIAITARSGEGGLGRLVGSAGDLNGDGYDDIFVASQGQATVPSLCDVYPSYQTENGSAVYVLYGKAGYGKFGGWGDIDLDHLKPAQGFRIATDATYPSPYFGDFLVSLRGIGDANGDGLDDLLIDRDVWCSWLIVAPNLLPYSSPSESFVIYGRTDNRSDFSLLDISPADGTRLEIGKPESEIGSWYRYGFDYNQDGVEDSLFISDISALSYMAFGQPADYTVSSNYWLVFEISNYHLPRNAGDINADGIADLAVNLNYMFFPWDFFGKDSITSDRESITIAYGQRLPSGILVDDTLSGGAKDGFSLSWSDDIPCVLLNFADGGDLNGDGIGDLLFASRHFDGWRAGEAGQAFVIYGESGMSHEDVDLDSLSPDQGYRIFGVNADAEFGDTIAGIGDINGDGIADIAIGAPNFDNGRGAVYVIYGRPGRPGDIDLAHLAPDQGFRLDGEEAGGRFGQTIGGGGDFNGDGYADFIIGAPLAGGAFDPGPYYSYPSILSSISAIPSALGRSYIFFGGDFTHRVSLPGSAGADRLEGSAQAETIIAGDGHDRIESGGGADIIRAGSGEDMIIVADNNFQMVDGGGGIDCLRFAFAGDIALARVADVEILDLANGLANRLQLAASDILDLDPRMRDVGGVPSLDNWLRIEGEAGDRLTLALGDAWSSWQGAGLPGYALYKAGKAMIAVDTDIAIDFV